MSGQVPKPALPNLNRNRHENAAEPVDLHALHWAQYPTLAGPAPTRTATPGCVFAKSCALPDGVINHNNPGGFVPVEQLDAYGAWAVLGTGGAITAEGTGLQWVGGSTTARALGSRLGGSLALRLVGANAVVAAGAAVGTVALLMPNPALTPDSAFYTQDQYAALQLGRTRVRVNVKSLPGGAVDAYGFYTGSKREWENVPVIRAAKDGERYVADIGHGIGLVWTPAQSPEGVLGIPALEGAQPLRTVWVYPPTPQAQTALENPAHPPEFQDAIVWFPADAGIEPIYVVLSTQLEKNKAAGAAFEEDNYPEFSEDKKVSAQQVTLNTRSGVKVRLDMIGKTSDGDIVTN